MKLLEIKRIAQAEMSDKRSSPYNERGDKYTHGERVATLAVRLRQIILPKESGRDDILTVAAWFHDICNGSCERAMHAVSGAERIRELLCGCCPNEILEQICDIVSVHDERKPTDKQYSNIIKIHQDADHLDHFGTFDIWRLVAYTAGHNETINEALQYMQNSWPTNNARWRDELHFELSKKIFDDKARYVKSFIERFAIESTGGIWREKDLLSEVLSLQRPT